MLKVDPKMAMRSLENIIPDLEYPIFQNIGLRFVLEQKRVCLAFDTGTGKTFELALIIRALLNRNPEKKHLVVIIHDSIDQLTRDVRSLTRVTVEAFDGSDTSLGHLKFFWGRTSIICLTLEAMRSADLIAFLFEHLMEIESITIDEAHHVANWDTSDTAMMVRSLAKWIPYVIELTATPVTRTSNQYYRLMNILDRTLSMHRDESYLDRYDDRYMPVNRADYDIKGNYKPTLITVKPTMDQLKPTKGSVFKTLKGYGATPQIHALIDTVRDRLSRGERIIIYIQYHATRHWVEENFDEQGISYVSLHGRITKREERQRLLDRFRNGEVDVLLTSVTESLNIDASVVIFYEFTTAVKQVIGRAHRGLEGKDLEIIFVITESSAEVDYFLKYIYDRSLMIQKLLGKDYAELVSIGEQVKKLQL